MKTVVYIDAANIILSAQNRNFNIDIPKVIQHIKDVYRTNHIIYFTGNFKSKHKEFSSLRSVGVELVLKEIYNESAKVKANCDVEIAHRVTSDILLDTIHKIVVLSGDGDFVHLYDFARRKNSTVKVIAFDPKSCSRMIKKRAFTKVSYLIELGHKIEKKNPR
jgi:uncharacterized LabA/DUF88 family protein